MKRLMLLLFVLLVPFTASAASPAVFPECLDRDPISDWRQAGAEDYEVLALRVITRDGLSKGWTDYVRVSDEELALGIAHFTVGRLRLPSPDPNTSDLRHYWRTMAVLYSDASGPLTLRAWRRIVGPAVAEARRHGWRRAELALAAALANSGPSAIIRYGESCDWRVRCVRNRYASTDHRRRRLAYFDHLQEQP